MSNGTVRSYSRLLKKLPLAARAGRSRCARRRRACVGERHRLRCVGFGSVLTDVKITAIRVDVLKNVYVATG